MLLSKLSWPTAIVLCVAILVVGATLLAGPAVGLDKETLHYALGGESLLGLVVLALMRALIGRGDEDADRDVKPAKKREPIIKRPPDSGALALVLVVVAACAVWTSACGAGTYGGHARAATIGAAGLSATGDVIDAARDRALDAVEAAHPVHGPERDAALEAEAARWRPAGVALDDAREGLLTYIDAVQLAETSGTDGLVAHLDVIAARFIALFNAVIATATEAGATGLQPLNLDSLFGGAQ